MECVSTHRYSANPADRITCRNECNTVILATCIATLRPLFLIIFKRPGWKNYQRRQPYNPTTSSRNRNKRTGRISNPTSDSKIAIGHADTEGSWSELGPNLHDAHNEGEIMQTLEFDVTSREEGEAKQSDGWKTAR